MKTTNVPMILGMLLCLVAANVSGLSCGQAAALVISKGDTEITMSMAEIKALSATEGTTYWMSHTGEIHGPYNVKGVSLDVLCGEAGGIGEGEEAVLTAIDGWASTFTYEQIQSCDFKAYDRETGDKIVSEDLTVVVAYEVDGQPIDPDTEGPLWTVITCPTDKAVYGAYFVKWTNHIEISNASAEWSVQLSGVVDEEMAHTTFMQVAAPGRHRVSWTDEEGMLWEGVPLWWLVARVDDDIEEGNYQLNEELADAGYGVYIEASDGYSKTLAIEDIRQHDDWVVAYKHNGQYINSADHNWPLKLTGPGLIDAMRVGGIIEIRLLLS